MLRQLACGSDEEPRLTEAWGRREQVPLNSNTLSRDKICTCCTTEHPRIVDYALFACFSFIATHCNSPRTSKCNLPMFSRVSSQDRFMPLLTPSMHAYDFRLQSLCVFIVLFLYNIYSFIIRSHFIPTITVRCVRDFIITS